jgi:hypothetical protein
MQANKWVLCSTKSGKTGEQFWLRKLWSERLKLSDMPKVTKQVIANESFSPKSMNSTLWCGA